MLLFIFSQFWRLEIWAWVQAELIYPESSLLGSYLHTGSLHGLPSPSTCVCNSFSYWNNILDSRNTDFEEEVTSRQSVIWEAFWTVGRILGNTNRLKRRRTTWHFYINQPYRLNKSLFIISSYIVSCLNALKSLLNA